MRKQALRYRVVGIGREDGVLPRIEVLLASSGGELYHVSGARSGIDILRSLGGVDLVLVEFPHPETPLDVLLSELYREVEYPPRVAVLAADGDGGKLPPLDDWDCVVLSCDRRPEALEKALASLIQRAPRVPARLMVRLEVASEESTRLRLAQTENISKSGMLVRTAESFTPEAAVRFELSFPDDPEPVSGEARVVRCQQADQEEVLGIGVQFLSLQRGGQLRLEGFLARASTEYRFPADPALSVGPGVLLR